ncbi:MAG: alpha-1,4-glucan--maltose-1-phosphate maltosyltransferase [Acetobacteraceae bacterium]|nr:alpha-1,4-glucan--maltose-1-phosphate maltosyltransferase [Acetobacteraceae bacterium]
MIPMGFEFATWRQMHPGRDVPEDFAAITHSAPFDLSAEIEAVNDARRAEPALAAGETPTVLAGTEAAAIALLRGRARRWDARERPSVILANLDPTRRHTVDVSSVTEAAGGAFERFDPVLPARATWLAAGDSVALEPGEVMVYRAQPASPQRIDRPPLTMTAEGACLKPRIAIEAISPCVEQGTYPAKRVAGETVTVEADIIADGHDVLGAVLLWRAAEDAQWQEAPMHPLGNDRWQGRFPVARVGPYLYSVEAWRDAFGTFRDELGKKQAAGVNTALEVSEGILLVLEAADRSEDAELRAIAARLPDEPLEEQRALLLSVGLAQLMMAADPRPFATRIEPALQILAERSAARFGSWYEIFPRSMSDDPNRHGTFDDVIRHLPRIRAMGFDVLYLTPVHPIGRINRKGRNNSLRTTPEDPGSPYAIGSKEGGHHEIHPELGRLEDFRRLRDAALREGLELAIDFAIQCAPDHPWLSAHKEWFHWRPDGSLRYAENPPKKYEDIVNVDFYAPGSIPSLWIALCETVLYWADEGIRLFRVDNPHTKPLPFWEWMIGEVRARYPDAVFLSEAFTRPKMMYRLAKVGFSQSYTYFIWRNTKRELTDYMLELTTTEPREFFRPHFFVNTPDINPLFLQASGRPGFLIRAALATTLSGLWGVYCGFELCEARALPGREEYADSEKYQIRAWDWDRPGNIRAEIAQLNQIRKANPALQTHLNLQFHNAWNDAVLYYEKATPDRSNVLLIAVSLDPHNAQEADFEVPLWNWGLPDSASLHVEDLLAGARAIWGGKRQHLRLEPAMPYAIWRVRPAG